MNIYDFTFALKITTAGIDGKLRVDDGSLEKPLGKISGSITRAINARLFPPGLIDRAALIEAEDLLARQNLKYQWKLSDRQLDERLDKIKQANKWDKSARFVWFCVLNGMEFDNDGKLETLDNGRKWIPRLRG